MNPASDTVPRPSIGALLRGEVTAWAAWTAAWHGHWVGRDLAWIVIGAGAFGLSMGWWRAPWQAVFSGLKLPLIMLLTAVGNAMLNGMLAPLLGLRLQFKQSFLAILASFASASAILGAFSPLAAFVIWNAPPLAEGAHNSTTHAAIMLLLVMVIAFAGVAANLRLYQWLRQHAADGGVAGRVLLAWLAGNLMLGSQLSWILRPFIGNPLMPVEFLRSDAFHGNFFETVARSIAQVF
jgi:hypothetical protein